MTKLTRVLKSPLFTTWSEQHVQLTIDGLTTGAPYLLRVNGQPTPYQYTGRTGEVLVRLGFDRGETKTLEFVPGPSSETDLSRVALPLEPGQRLGVDHCAWTLGNPFAGIGAFPLESTVRCAVPLEARTLTRTNQGPLFIDYELVHQYAEARRYRLGLRCYRAEPIIEVAESFNLGLNAELEIVCNPQRSCDRLLSHAPVEFEADSQPTVEALGGTRPYDLLCRLQLPRVGDYFVPLNRFWFAFFESQQESRGLLGILGLYGARWTNAVVNMPAVYDDQCRAVWRASLTSGQRYWLWYTGPVEQGFRTQVSGVSVEGEAKTRDQRTEIRETHIKSPPLKPETRNLTPVSHDGRFVFNRLQAEFNGLRLDEHLDLTGDVAYDAHCWDQPGFFGADYRQRARTNVPLLSPLRRTAEQGKHLSVQALLDPQPATQQPLFDAMLARLEKWVRQFQGVRENKPDYNKSVIGFSRVVRSLLIDYELLRKDRFLSDAVARQLQALFVFTARRMMDEARWPHSHTWQHPDHPDSTRNFYTYGGEHKPDKLVWTNCLPNFQSDPMCSLLHLSALLPEHPDAARWRQFALDDIDRQLDAYCGRSGAWEESILYALYTMSYFVPSFRILKNRCSIDYFHDPRVRAFAGWLTRFFGPLDKRFGVHTHPAIGNARLPQEYCECLLAFASELAADDPLRADLIAVYQRIEPALNPTEHRPLLLAIATAPDRAYPLRPLVSEHMDDLGVALRHAHPSPQESYLFQKIGFWKDHYEDDETSFNWYAKGTPLVMDYGTYTGDAGAAAAHNLVEIPDADALRRGYLAEKLFTPLVDFTRCEVPVTLKLSFNHMRSFAEVDGPPQKPVFFYLGEENPVGPKVWKTRSLLFVKPDYVVLFDRVFGAVPHRFNLQVTADTLARDGAIIRATGRFDLDLLCYVQHPAEFEFASGEFFPAPHLFGKGPENQHRQRFFRLCNTADGIYRTVLFAQERGRTVTLEPLGDSGLRIVTPEYEDHVFLSDEVLRTDEFTGRAGWIRRETSGTIRACVPNGDRLAAFGRCFEGRGPWSYNLDGKESVIVSGPPRPVKISPTK